MKKRPISLNEAMAIALLIGSNSLMPVVPERRFAMETENEPQVDHNYRRRALLWIASVYAAAALANVLYLLS